MGHFFREEGALFIPAHLHQAKPAENSRSIDDIYDDEAFLGFIRDGAFDALEVRDPTTARFFDGRQKTKEGLEIPHSICVASSDAHHHEHIASRGRTTWVRVEDNTYRELTAALSFRHRIALSCPVESHPHIIGVHIVGSFIPDAWVSLNEGLNALIGGKGSGKTALLECLRFVLNTPVPKERAESVNRHIDHVLGPSGYVECLVKRDDGTESLLTRRADSRDRISVTDFSDNINWRNASDGPPFPISILGWHEIEAVADRAQARVELVDRVGDPSVVRTAHEKIKEQIERARDRVPLLQRQIKKLDAGLKELWELQRKRATLARLEKGELLALQNQYEWFLQTEQRLQSLRTDVSVQQTRIPDDYKTKLTFPIAPVPDPTAIGSAADAVVNVQQALTSVVEDEAQAMGKVQKALTTVDASAVGAAEKITAAFGEFREKVYTPKVNQLPPEDRDILSKQIQVLEDTKRLPVAEKACEDLLREMHSAAKELSGICSEICDLREQIATHRQALVTALNSELQDVKLRFLGNSNQASRDQFQTRYGAEATALLGWLGTFGQGGSYQNLKTLFDKLATLQLDENEWKINDLLWDIKFVEFLDVIDDDDIEVSLRVGEAGFVAIQNLSAGQRCVAVFPILLRNTQAPLVIDQPEDNLDNRYIADVIAPDLLLRKTSQQLLVTSHNANLVVLTDADLIVHLDSDGSRCSFLRAGFLACPTSTVKQSVLDVLDGGEAALAARQRKYGVR